MKPLIPTQLGEKKIKRFEIRKLSDKWLFFQLGLTVVLSFFFARFLSPKLAKQRAGPPTIYITKKLQKRKLQFFCSQSYFSLSKFHFNFSTLSLYIDQDHFFPLSSESLPLMDWWIPTHSLINYSISLIPMRLTMAFLNSSTVACFIQRLTPSCGSIPDM